MKKCNTVTLKFEVKDNRIENSEVQRVYLDHPAALHVVDSSTGKCVRINIKRVLECQEFCGWNEYKYDFPFDPCFPILPAGVYEMCVGKQDHYLDVDVKATVNVILEPIDDQFINIVTANRRSC